MLDALKEIVTGSPGFYVAWGGLLIGLTFGFIVFRTNFCTMGSISDILTFGDYGRFRAWLLAGAVAMVGVTILQLVGVMSAADTMYMTPRFGWLGNVVGGLMFGFGMVYAGGCVSRNLVRAGGGDMRSLVILIIAGIFAFMTIGGLKLSTQNSICPIAVILVRDGIFQSKRVRDIRLFSRRWPAANVKV